jgi:hypothetical protein
MARFAFLREAQIWYNRGVGKIPWQQFENIIVLSEEFYKEVLAHPIPTDLEAVKVLSGAPAVLDLFMWLCYRCFVSNGEEAIPLFGQYGLAHQLGSVEYSRPRRFRAMIEQWLGVVRALWPECPARLSSDGRALAIDYGTPVNTGRVASKVHGNEM